MSFTARSISIPETASPSISWSIKEHKMVEESRKNKVGFFYRFSDRMRHMEQILNDVPPIAKEIERAYFPRLFDGGLWSGLSGQVVTLSNLNLGEWTHVTATTAGTATASGSTDRVIGRVMETNMEVTPEGRTNTTAKIQLRR